jgi:hypothetical protein
MCRTPSDFAYDNFGWLLLAGCAALGGLLAFALTEDNAHAERFMAECTRDHKNYECDAMWRAGEPKTVVAPVVMGR